MRNIPIIPFVPFFGAAIRRERQTGFLYPEVGNSSTKGAFLKIPFFWAISDSQDLTVALDTYTRRGVGVEGDYRYIMSERARGSAGGFLIPEFLRDSQDRERLDIPLWRGARLGKARLADHAAAVLQARRQRHHRRPRVPGVRRPAR